MDLWGLILLLKVSVPTLYCFYFTIDFTAMINYCVFFCLCFTNVIVIICMMQALSSRWYISLVTMIARLIVKKRGLWRKAMRFLMVLRNAILKRAGCILLSLRPERSMIAWTSFLPICFVPMVSLCTVVFLSAPAWFNCKLLV